MFIKNSFADEIAHNMAERLDEEKVSQATARERNLVQAADYLNSVAEIYEELGMHKASEAVTRIMEVTASEDQKVHETTDKVDDKNCAMCGSKKSDSNMAFDDAVKALYSDEDDDYEDEDDFTHRFLDNAELDQEI